MASPQPSPAPLSTSVQPAWPLSLRLVFRFFCCYWILAAALPRPQHAWVFSSIPGARTIFRPNGALWRAVCPWVAIHIFHLTGKATTYFPTGSTDTALGYILELCYVVTACIAAVVWSIMDRKPQRYESLHDWLRVLVRYALAVGLLTYGVAKILPIQFASVDLNHSLGRLIEPYGQFSPFAVLWSFMGTSRPYTIFTGIVETTGCVLLLFRRTTTLGAMVSAAALMNVVVLDFCYGIDVKLGALNLLSMAFFLLAPEIRRLARVLLLNCATAPIAFRPLWPVRPWSTPTIAVFKTAFIAILLFSTVQWAWNYRERALPQGPLFGIYDVEKFVENGRERPLLSTESDRWSMVAVMDHGTGSCGVAVRNSDDSMLYYACTVSPGKSGLTLSNAMVSLTDAPSFSSKGQTAFTYSRPDAEHLVLQNSQFTISMRRVTTAYPLLTRGFHWIDTGLNR